ncbi:MAG: sporulation integral membrane protein YtvI [Clostridia bacterium]|nr:sporulation integral membrane protein YtvI [Clostridia bacterium]
MEKIIDNRKSFIINFFYFAIFIGLYYFVVKYAFGYILPFVVAAALAVFLQKPVRKISSKLHIKTHGAVSTILVLLIVVIIVGAAGLLGWVLVSELKEFFTYLFSRFDSVNDVIVTVREFVMGIVAKLPRGLGATVSNYVSDFFNNLSTESSVIDMEMLSAPLSGAWSVVKGIPSAFLSVLVTIISCVFMTYEYDLIKNMILDMLTESKGKKLVSSKQTVTRGISKLVKAYATLMLITFSEMFLGLNLMKLIGVYEGGYIAIIAFVTCIVDIIPVLGTGTVLIPWAVYNLVMGNVGLGIGLLVLYAVITVLRQILEPKLVANQAGLPAIATIMAMFIGARLFGAFGILLLPLTVIILKLMYDEGVIGNKKLLDSEREEKESEPTQVAQEKGAE